MERNIVYNECRLTNSILYIHIRCLTFECQIFSSYCQHNVYNMTVIFCYLTYPLLSYLSHCYYLPPSQKYNCSLLYQKFVLYPSIQFRCTSNYNGLNNFILICASMICASVYIERVLMCLEFNNWNRMFSFILIVFHKINSELAFI